MRRLLPTVALLLLVAGCEKPEPPTFPVQGTVLVDGKPPVGYRVAFSSEAEETKGLNAGGTVSADGTFTVITRYEGKEKPGAVAGVHKVAFVPPGVQDVPEIKVFVPLKFLDYKSSDLTAEVKPGDLNPVRLELKP